MLKERTRLFQVITMMADNIVVIFSYMLAILLREKFAYLFENPFTGSFYENARLLIVILPIWSTLFVWFGLYVSKRRSRFRKECEAIFKAVFVGMIAIHSIVFILKIEDMSRVALTAFGILSVGLLAIERLSIRTMLKLFRRRGYDYRNILMVGSGKRSREFVRMIRNHSEWGIRIYGFIDEDTLLQGQAIEGAPVVGQMCELKEILDKHVIDEVVFITPKEWLDKVEEAMLACEEVGVQVAVSIDYFKIQWASPDLTELNGFPMLTYSMLPSQELQRLGKRLFDIVASSILLILLSPVFLITALAVAITSHGPIIFSQVRLGENKRQFNLYKFRTMIENAEEKMAELLTQNEADGPVFKIKKDPRVTSLGMILRRTSIDELPQLFNVLKGEMSLVGPRPPLSTEVDEYHRWQRRRLSMKPGITGLWQVSGRSNVSFNEWIKLDLEYIDKWSFWLDIKILLKTVVVVVRGHGAY